MQKVLTYFLLAVIVLGACSKDENPPPVGQPNNGLETGWTVPVDQLVLSQLPPDRIPSIDDPHFESLNNHNLSPQEIAYVYRHGNTVKVYPQNILWHHEIVNDQNGDHHFAVTFCPLTGSAVAWNREIDGVVTEFGVSGHLFNENLIPYDRNSQSFWSQMHLQSIKGISAGEELKSEFLLSTTGATIKTSFPNALVLVDTSGHHCDSVCRSLKSGLLLEGQKNGSTFETLSGDYFGIVKVGQIKEPEALLFDYGVFGDSINVFQTHFRSSRIVVAGSRNLQFIVAFVDNSGNPENQFAPLHNELPVIMEDNYGNRYDISGLVVSGPAAGNRLPSPRAYTAHAFAWGLFFGNNIEFFEYAVPRVKHG